MPDKYEINGTIDAGWTSYFDSGETIKKNGDADASGTMTTETLPADVDLDELTDKQARIVQVAVENPHYTTYDVAEHAEVSNPYTVKMLNRFVPEWYENTFKTTGGSKPTPKRDDEQEDADADESGDSNDETPPARSARRRTHTPTRTTNDNDTSHTVALVACVAFVVGYLWGRR